MKSFIHRLTARCGSLRELYEHHEASQIPTESTSSDDRDVDRVVEEIGAATWRDTSLSQKINGGVLSRAYECNEAAGSNWTQNWRKYGAADLVSLILKLILIMARLPLHTCYLTGERHERKISNHLPTLISVYQIGA